MSNVGMVADGDPLAAGRRIRRLAAFLVLVLVLELAALLIAGAGPGQGRSDPAGGQGAAAGNQGSGEFTITGSITAFPDCTGPGPLLPGVDRCLTYTVRNLLGVPITVTAISISGVSAPAACAASNLDVDDTAFAGALEVPAGGTASTPGLPISLRETGLNQDACKDVSFALRFAGSARHGAVAP